MSRRDPDAFYTPDAGKRQPKRQPKRTAEVVARRQTAIAVYEAEAERARNMGQGDLVITRSLKAFSWIEIEHAGAGLRAALDRLSAAVNTEPGAVETDLSATLSPDVPYCIERGCWIVLPGPDVLYCAQHRTPLPLPLLWQVAAPQAGPLPHCIEPGCDATQTPDSWFCAEHLLGF